MHASQIRTHTHTQHCKVHRSVLQVSNELFLRLLERHTNAQSTRTSSLTAYQKKKNGFTKWALRIYTIERRLTQKAPSKANSFLSVVYFINI